MGMTVYHFLSVGTVDRSIDEIGFDRLYILYY